MQHISCGCTPHHADTTCKRGCALFTAAAQAFQELAQGTGAIASDERQALYTLAHLAYIDHLRGWQEGDLKVQRQMDTWMAFVRTSGRWIFHVGTKDRLLLEAWLQVRGYHQFVKGGGTSTKEQISGYYRTTRDALPEGNAPFPISPERGSQDGLTSDASGARGGQSVSSRPSFPMDLKTQVAIAIALHIARMPHAPNVVEYLHIQRRATSLLRVHGLSVGPQDERTLREIIDEAIRQQTEMNASRRQNTQQLEQ